MAHRLWMYGLAHPRTAVVPFIEGAALDVQSGDIVRKIADKLYVGLVLGVNNATATVRWAWQRNTSDEVPIAELQRQQRAGESQ